MSYLITTISMKETLPPLVWQSLCQTEALACQSRGKFSNLLKNKEFEIYGILKYLDTFPIADKTSTRVTDYPLILLFPRKGRCFLASDWAQGLLPLLFSTATLLSEIDTCQSNGGFLGLILLTSTACGTVLIPSHPGFYLYRWGRGRTRKGRQLQWLR